jgi:hypothetical protein
MGTMVEESPITDNCTLMRVFIVRDQLHVCISEGAVACSRFDETKPLLLAYQA